MTPLPQRLDPKNDAVFKLLIGGSEPLLISLLTAVLRPEVPIRRAIVQNPGLPKDFPDDKGSFLDIAMILDDDTRIDVEMQTSRLGVFCDRTLYYWAGLFRSQLPSGTNYGELSRVVSVAFLDYRQFPSSHFHEVFRLRGDASGEVFSPLLEIHTIELPKLTREQATAEPALARWCRFFSSADPREIHDLTEEDPMIEQAEKRLEELSSDPEVRQAALSRDYRDVSIRLSLGAARKEGREEGKALGECLLLEKLLTSKFGPLSEETAQRLQRATESELMLWAERSLTATTLDEVFAAT
jgi:predicted transposase/invertase (TIGR01784 family)